MDIRVKTPDASTVLELTTPTSGLSINSALGSVIILITPAQTAALAAGTYVYDLELEETSTGTVTRVLQGNLTVRAEVTK